MKMKEICQLTVLSKRNIHYYISENLLSPRQDPINGYYNFSEEDYIALLTIQRLRMADFSIEQIRAIIQNPQTSVYYINQHLKQLRKKITYFTQLESAVSFMQKNIPFHPTITDLKDLCDAAHIPEKPDPADRNETLNDINLVNRYLWESYLPETPFTEYQEFLWNKINRITLQECEEDYHLLSMSLHELNSRQIETFFSDNRKMHEKVIGLKEHQFQSYADQMKQDIIQFLQSPSLIRNWKMQYTNIYAPSTRLYDSQIAKLMDELSPSFATYRKNIHITCNIVYEWLHSNEGKDVLASIYDTLGPLCDIDSCSHGQLQAIASCVHFPS